MIDTKEFCEYLKGNGLDFFAGVPDSLLKNFCAYLKTNLSDEQNIIAANEGNAVAMGAGHYLATGRPSVIYMQNSGIGNAVNPLLSLVDEEVYRIPMLLVVGWRGEPGVHDEPQHVKQGKVTLKLFEAMGIRTIVLDEGWRKQLDECLAYMTNEGKPVALIVRKGVFSEVEGVRAEAKDDDSRAGDRAGTMSGELRSNAVCGVDGTKALDDVRSRLTMKREEVLETILGNLGGDDFVVSTTGKTSREIFEIRERRGEAHSHDFLTVGSMGHTASIALGVSLGTRKNIYCIDGDGSFLMHMGGFAVIPSVAKANFKYIMINNGAHESVGGQPTVGFQINAREILLGCGFQEVIEAWNTDEIKVGIEKMRKGKLIAMIIYTEVGSRDDLGRPTISPVENKANLMEALGDE